MNKNFFKQDILGNNGPFFIGLFLFLFIGCGLIEYYGKDNLHLLLNSYHSPFWDVFFKYLTNISLPVMGLSAIYICIKYYNYKTLLFLATAFFLNSLLIMLVKRIFFEHGHRPTYYFELKGVQLHLVEGVTHPITYTFPSGHSANAFFFMLFFSMVTKNKWLKLLSFCIAFLVAYSRIYLSKHFVIDTLGGSVLGVFCIILFFYYFKGLNAPSLLKKIKIQ